MSYTFNDLTVPGHIIDSIEAYVETGMPTGGFLQAVIDNDLRNACGRADMDNLPLIPAIVGYLYNNCPSGCWGFTGASKSWTTKKRIERTV